MRTLEHRRHSRRDPGGEHLNAAGKALARRVAASAPSYDRVVASPKTRAVETAEAVGGRVDAILAGLAEMPDELGLLAERPSSFADFAALCRRSATAREFASRQLDLWRSELDRVPEGGKLLLVSHGGIIEFGAVAAVPEAAPRWGGPLGYLEGIRLEWDGRHWRRGEVVRVPA